MNLPPLATKLAEIKLLLREHFTGYRITGRSLGIKFVDHFFLFVTHYDEEHMF